MILFVGAQGVGGTRRTDGALFGQEIKLVLCYWRMSVLVEGSVLILGPLVQAVDSGLTNVLATKQAMYHALFPGKCPPLMLRTSPHSKRHGPVFHWLH